MVFGKLKTWMKKMNQILDLYQDNDEFTSTEKALLLDYTNKMKIEIQKLNVLDADEEIQEDVKVTTLSRKDASKVELPMVTPSTDNSFVIEPIPVEIQYHEEMYTDLFDHLDISDLSTKLELKPLADIKLGMGLNEKIQTQNELFNGDKNAFEEIIVKLNQFPDFNSAKLFLCEHVIPKYNWTQSTKEKTVNMFIKLVKRRHL